MSNLRELKIQLDLIDNASAGLEGVNTELDGMESTVGETRDGVSDLGHETKGYGHESKGVLEQVKGNWAMIGGAIAGAGMAMEMFVRSQQESIESSERLAYATGMTGEEVRSLAIDLQDATFALDDVYGILAIGRQQMLKSEDELKSFAKFWDLVGDGSMENSVQLAKAGVSLRSVGIAAGDEEDALAAFGFIFQETTGSVSEFLHMLDRTGPQIREMGMDVDDTAALVGALEHEFGLTARTARQEFRSAVNDADGDFDTLLETLELSEEAFMKYRGAVDDSGDIIRDTAQIAYDAKTPLQHLQAEFEGWTHSLAGWTTPLIEILSPIATGIGSIVAISSIWAGKFVGLSAIVGGVGTKLAGMGTAIAVAGKVIVGIGAAIVGAIGIIPVAIAAAAVAIGFGIAAIVDNWDWLKSKFLDTFAFYKGIGEDVINGIVSGVLGLRDKLIDTVTGIAGDMASGFKDFFGIASDSKLMLEYGSNIMGGLDTGMHESTPDKIPTPPVSYSPVTAGGGGMTFAPVINISGYTGDASDLANKIDSRLRSTFGEYAEKYFSSQRRRRPRKREEELN